MAAEVLIFNLKPFFIHEMILAGISAKANNSQSVLAGILALANNSQKHEHYSGRDYAQWASSLQKPVRGQYLTSVFILEFL
ncbi:MAG: hypothetical protein Q7T38_08095 [Gallionella sp.]|nr:hypothetical protein [Gallionella sp.]